MPVNKRTYCECPQINELIRLSGSQAMAGDLLQIGRSSVSRYVAQNKAPAHVEQLAGYLVEDLAPDEPEPEPEPVDVPVPAAFGPMSIPAAIAATAPVDGAGVAYDQALHASPPTIKGDGTWRKKRGTNVAYSPAPVACSRAKRRLVLALVPVDEYKTTTRILDGMNIEHFDLVN